jgi:hypothetical protein
MDSCIRFSFSTVIFKASLFRKLTLGFLPDFIIKDIRCVFKGFAKVQASPERWLAPF